VQRMIDRGLASIRAVRPLRSGRGPRATAARGGTTAAAICLLDRCGSQPIRFPCDPTTTTTEPGAPLESDLTDYEESSSGGALSSASPLQQPRQPRHGHRPRGTSKDDVRVRESVVRVRPPPRRPGDHRGRPARAVRQRRGRELVTATRPGREFRCSHQPHMGRHL
jgi:hypothetical protein